MQITEQQLLQIFPNARAQAGVFVSALNQAMAEFLINTPRRQAAFLAQVGHESGELQFTRELGSHQYLDRYDTGKLAERLGNTPADDDDGQLYRGRGLIQITGRRNYLMCSIALFRDDRLLREPALLEQPELAARSAAWFWFKSSCNSLADGNEFLAITKRINGGTNGIADRRRLWAKAREVLGCN